MFKFRLIRQLLLVALLMFTGCPKAPTPTQATDEGTGFPPDLLTLLVIDDSGFADAIERQWQAEFNGQLNLMRLSSAEMIEQDFQVPENVDLVLYPHGMLGEFEARRQLIEVPNSVWQATGFNKNELLPLHRSRMVRHANRVFGVSLGGPQLMWLYDRQWLDQQSLALPQTWDLALPWLKDRFAFAPAGSDNSPPVAPTKDALIVPLAEGWAVYVFLARVAPMIRSRGRLASVFDRSTMQPLIDQAPFRLALEDLKAMMGNNQECLEMTPADVYQQIITGKAKMGIGWPNDRFIDQPVAEIDAIESDRAQIALVDVGLAMLPGSNQWYDIPSRRWNQRMVNEGIHYDLVGVQGSLLSVTTKSRSIDSAFQFISWLGNKSAPLKTIAGYPEFGPFRQTHLGDPVGWTGSLLGERSGDEFAEIIRLINQQDVPLLFPRIPGRHLFLAALDEQVRACLQDQITPEEALSKAAARWKEIVDEKGTETMIKELRKDAGI